MQRNCSKFCLKILSLKNPQNVNFEWFLRPNDPFRLYSYCILCPTGPMEEQKKITIPLPLKNTTILATTSLTLTMTKKTPTEATG